jgi:hypothetical protein
VLTEIDQKIKASDFSGAIQEALSRFELPSQGAVVSFDSKIPYDPKNKKVVYAVTGQDTLGSFIHIGRAALIDPCTLVSELRHEIEHFWQRARATACESTGVPSVFEDHFVREQTAYLNDEMNVENICPGASHAEWRDRKRSETRGQYQGYVTLQEAAEKITQDSTK